MYLGNLLDITYWSGPCLRCFLGQMFENGKTEVQGRFALELLGILVVSLTNFSYIFFYEIWQRNSPYMVVYSYQIWCRSESVSIPNQSPKV